MYRPVYFKIEDEAEIVAFMEEHSFATIVSVDERGPIATHIPMQVKREGKHYVLTGHVAYANRQWRTFEQQRVLVIFQGPHAYVSSSWYDHENVPTWNYQAVHVYGQVMLLTEDELRNDLASQLRKYEQHREQPILWDTLSEEVLAKQLKGIVGFKVKIDVMQATYKLSQNRHVEDFDSIVKHLQHEKQPGAKHVACAMQKIKTNSTK